MKYGVLFALLFACILNNSVQAQVSPLTLLFSANIMEVGKSAVINVLIDCQVESCAAADLSISFDPDALRVDDLSLGEFLNKTGNMVYVLKKSIDVKKATISLRYVTLNNGNLSSTGAGVLLHITAVALREGKTELRFTQASIASEDGQTIYTPQTLVGTIDAVSHQTSQIVLVQAEVGDPNKVTVKEMDANHAVISETIIGQSLQIEVNSVPNSSAELVIDAPGHLGCTLYGSEDRNITLPAGDVNNDGTIDIRDAATVGVANTPTSQNAQDEADLNHDGIVNVYDLIHIGRNYGLSSGEC
jgi:hypothetical protein